MDMRTATYFDYRCELLRHGLSMNNVGRLCDVSTTYVGVIIRKMMSGAPIRTPKGQFVRDTLVSILNNGNTDTMAQALLNNDS